MELPVLIYIDSRTESPCCKTKRSPQSWEHELNLQSKKHSCPVERSPKHCRRLQPFETEWHHHGGPTKAGRARLSNSYLRLDLYLQLHLPSSDQSMTHSTIDQTR